MVDAAQALVLLNAQAVDLRAELLRLHANLAEMRLDVGGNRGAELLEANQQLILAALLADDIAEKATVRLKELTAASQRDILTNTLNRQMMLERLEAAIVSGHRHHAKLAVMFVDLDHFKQVNDTLGHAIGDDVLRLVAARLQSVVRGSDAVSRHGGDEFLVLLAEISHAGDAGLVARKMLASLAAPCQVGNHVLHLSASIGVAVHPDDGADAGTLIEHADAAMYRAKKRGRDCFVFHADGTPPHDAGGRTDRSQSGRLAGPSGTRQPGLDPTLRDLREANQNLVIATLGAHEMQARSDDAHRRQVTFLAMVAHELRSPLSPISTAAGLLKHARHDAPMLERLQVIITRQVTHMSRLVEDLLDGARVNSGKFRLACCQMDFVETLRMAIETTGPALERRSQHLSVRMPSNPVLVYGDVVRLAQVFSNLLHNASKYTPEGGEITLAATVSAKQVQVAVADNGIGITADALRNIFDLFVQDAHAVDHHGGGLGIGLAVVRELVEAHAGHVTGSSRGLGLGSEFVVTLPLMDPR